MKSHSRRYGPRGAVVICRAALARGPLHRDDSGKWRFGRRLFDPQTVNALIDAGEAIRKGNTVVST